MTSPRVPRLVLVSWALAVAGVLGLAVAVAHFLSGSGASMPGMHGSTADALTRGGSRGPLDVLTVSRLFTAWQLDALAVAVVLVAAAAYLSAMAFAAGRHPGERWPARRTAAFLAGLAVIGYATNGAIAVYDQALFTAHMAGHLALVMVAPALLAAGRPLTLAMAAATPARRARLERVATGRVVAVLTAPPVALAAYTAVIVGSHLTGLMDTIMRHTWAGQLEHLVYLVVGYQFFVLIVGNEPVRWRLASPARWLLLAIAMAVDTFTGIVLMQGTHSVALAPSALHVNALSDTHTGGAIMWFGGDGIMAAIMVGLVITWLRVVDTAAPERGWLEQARSATFAQHTGSANPATDADLDSDDDARAAYNAWLAELATRGD